MPARTLSSDSMTLHSISQYDQMDSEVRAQIQSNIHVLYEPNLAPLIHIATCRGHDGAYLAFLVKQDNLAKALSNPNSLASEPKTTRSAAMVSLLEATEQRIAEIFMKEKIMRESSSSSSSNNSGKKNSNPVSAPDPKIIRVPTNDNISIDYGEKPKERGFMPWRKLSRVESSYARNGCN